MQTTIVPDYGQLTNRYIALWNGDDEDARRSTIRALWADDGAHIAPTIKVRDLEELEARVTCSYQRWIVENGCRFRLKGSPSGHHNVVRFTWEMIDRDGNVESVGTEILVLDEAGKISVVYQFIEE